MNLKKLLVLVTTIAALSGCVAQWQQVNQQNRTVTQSGMTVDLPIGWVSLNFNEKLNLSSTDGPSLNSVVVETLSLKDIAKKLKVPVDNNMDMLEASKKYIAYWSSQKSITDFDVVEEDYIELASKGHYYVEWTYKDENGTTIRQAAQGTVKGGDILNVTFTAPDIYYYKKSIATVKDIFASVRYVG